MPGLRRSLKKDYYRPYEHWLCALCVFVSLCFKKIVSAVTDPDYQSMI